MKQIFFYNALLDSDANDIIETAMYDFLTLYEDGEFLRRALKAILRDEGTGTEASSIKLSIDIEGREPEFDSEYFSEYFVFNYLDDYIVLELFRGVRIFIDWCLTNASHVDDVIELCDQVKKKFLTEFNVVI